MRHIAPISALAFGLAFAPSAQSADILGSCQEDIATYCSSVEPGHGRIAACLYAHETVLTEECSLASADHADVLDLVFARLRFVKQECGEDIRGLCDDVALGQGRLFSCLAEQRAALSQSCTAVIDNVELPGD